MKTSKLMLIIPEMCMGGAQRSLAKLSLELANHATIFLVVFNNDRPVAYNIAGELISLEVYPGKSLFSRVYAFWQRVRRLRALKKKLKIDISISFLEGADYINILSKQSEKVILSIRGSKLHDEIMRNHFFWLRSSILIPWLYRRADLIIAVNHGIAHELIKHYGLPKDRVETIGNFYDFEEIATLSKESKANLGLLYQDSVLITTGRLSLEKGLRYLIRVFIKLKAMRKSIRLIIVGDGPELDQLVLICNQASLQLATGQSHVASADVIFMGKQNNVFKYLSGATLYLMNSSSEGFPNGMVEAMICGVPVISSDCPYGPREILAPDLNGGQPVASPFISSYGVLMPVANSEKNVEVWANTIVSVLKNGDLRDQLIKNGKGRAQTFDREKVISQWLKILR